MKADLTFEDEGLEREFKKLQAGRGRQLGKQVGRPRAPRAGVAHSSAAGAGPHAYGSCRAFWLWVAFDAAGAALSIAQNALQCEGTLPCGTARPANECKARNRPSRPLPRNQPTSPSPAHSLRPPFAPQFHFNRAGVWGVVLLRVLLGREWGISAAVTLVLLLPAFIHWLPMRLYTRCAAAAWHATGGVSSLPSRSGACCRRRSWQAGSVGALGSLTPPAPAAATSPPPPAPQVAPPPQGL